MNKVEKNTKNEKINKESLFFTAENTEKVRRKIYNHNKSQNKWLIKFFK